MLVLATSSHPRGASALRRVRRRAAEFLAAIGRTDAELSIVLVTDGRIRTLNRNWRGKDRSTDVLSFPISEPAGSGTLLGDVIISLDTAARRARADGRRVGEELDRYLAHGLLHLVGFDHEQPEDARAMAEQEAALVRGEGLVGAALRTGAQRAGRTEERWTRLPTSISILGTRSRTSRASAPAL